MASSPFSLELRWRSDFPTPPSREPYVINGWYLNPLRNYCNISIGKHYTAQKLVLLSLIRHYITRIYTSRSSVSRRVSVYEYWKFQFIRLRIYVFCIGKRSLLVSIVSISIFFVAFLANSGKNLVGQPSFILFFNEKIMMKTIFLLEKII